MCLSTLWEVTEMMCGRDFSPHLYYLMCDFGQVTSVPFMEHLSLHERSEGLVYMILKVFFPAQITHWRALLKLTFLYRVPSCLSSFLLHVFPKMADAPVIVTSLRVREQTMRSGRGPNINSVSEKEGGIGRWLREVSWLWLGNPRLEDLYGPFSSDHLCLCVCKWQCGPALFTQPLTVLMKHHWWILHSWLLLGKIEKPPCYCASAQWRQLRWKINSFEAKFMQ